MFLSIKDVLWQMLAYYSCRYENHKPQSVCDRSPHVIIMTDHPHFLLSTLHHHFPLSWKEWVVDPAEQFYYVWLQVMIFPIVYNWVIIILRYNRIWLYRISSSNHTFRHLTCNHLTSLFLLDMFSQDMLHYNWSELPACVAYTGLSVRPHVYGWHDHHCSHR